VAVSWICAGFPPRECSPYSQVQARRESLGFVRRSWAISCLSPRANPNVTIRVFCASLYQAVPSVDKKQEGNGKGNPNPNARRNRTWVRGVGWVYHAVEALTKSSAPGSGERNRTWVRAVGWVKHDAAGAAPATTTTHALRIAGELQTRNHFRGDANATREEPTDTVRARERQCRDGINAVGCRVPARLILKPTPPACFAITEFGS
jgi:hypothetical protein